MHAIVLYAHGARDPQWAAPIHAIRDRVVALRPELVVEIAFLEHMSPSLDEATASLHASGVRDVRVLPLFLARGGHLKRDLPEQIARVRATWPDLRIDATAALGEDAIMVDAIARWAIDTGGGVLPGGA
ncbi:MAG: CbiX/SirB N-terminal domain-containing protein [Burkholderiales bacterium]|jgi:sirohydrochlorin cobaltochelatase|nr:CbiX/SirB N-terminal domain-containing protein [Burkholderiales bacterium]